MIANVYKTVTTAESLSRHTMSYLAMCETADLQPFIITDIITRGASPKSLDKNSKWQNGPEIFSLPVAEWPLKAAKELASTARESTNKLQ